MSIPHSYKDKPLIHQWAYYDSNNNLLGIVGRYQIEGGKKDIVPFFNENLGMGIPESFGNKRPLFGLEKLATHDRNKAVFICEGEKAAAALQSMGITAITSIGGAQAANKTDWAPLSGVKSVYILPDNDKPGQTYAKDVYNALQSLESPPDVKILPLSGLPEGGDVVDWVQSWLPEWNGYAPIEPELVKALRDDFKAELQNAVPVPDDWKITSKPPVKSVNLDYPGVTMRVHVSGLNLVNPESFQWETPSEIEAKTPPVMAMSVDLIPEPFRPWLADVSHRMQTPPDFATVSAVVISGSVIGAGCSIRPKRFDDWEVIPNVWGAVIAPPSCLKSPTMGESIRMLDRLQVEYGEQFDKEGAANEFDKKFIDSQLADVENRMKKAAKGIGKNGVVDEVAEDIVKLKTDYIELTQNTPPEPTRRLFKANETSIQSMTKLQNENERGILVFRDELTGLLVKWDREDGQDERAYFLEGWNGNGSYTDNKIGRGLIEAKQICISLLGGIQPDKLKRYLYQAMKGNNDGLMQRLQLAVWPDMSNTWELIDTIPNKADKDRAYGIIKTLAELDFISYGAVNSEYDNRPHFHFDEPAQAVFNDWLTILQTKKIPNEENPLMIEHLGKFRSLMPSLALIFHCIDIADGKATGQVSEKAALLAVKWCEYLESHARRIYAMAESPEHEAAVRLADKVKARKLPSPFTSKMVYDKGWHGLKDKSEVEAACNILIDENWLIQTRKPVSSKGGRTPLPEFHINPEILS